MQKQFLMIIGLLFFTLNSFAETNHCTQESMDGVSFLNALSSWKSELNRGRSLADPTFSFSKAISLQAYVYRDQHGKAYDQRMSHVDSKTIGTSCHVTMTVQTPTLDRKGQDVTLAQGSKHKFSDKNLTVQVQQAPGKLGYFEDGNIVRGSKVIIADSSVKLEIYTTSACTAGQVVASLKEMGVDASFMTPKNNVECAAKDASSKVADAGMLQLSPELNMTLDSVFDSSRDSDHKAQESEIFPGVTVDQNGLSILVWRE